MTRIRKFLFALAVVTAISACNKNNAPKVNCAAFREGILAKDRLKVNTSVEPMLGIHSLKEFNRLTTDLSALCGVEVESTCFGCLYSLPPQSIVTLIITDNGAASRRSFVISEDSNHRMVIGDIQ